MFKVCFFKIEMDDKNRDESNLITFLSPIIYFKNENT